MSLATRLHRHNIFSGIFYGWIIVLVSFIVIGLVFGVRLSFGLFFDTLTHSGEFGWTRADTALAFSLTMIVFALTSTWVGWSLDRWGVRRVFVVGLLVLASGLALTSRMMSLVQFYLFYGVWTGFGITILGLSMQAAVIARWFDQLGRRGLAIGLAFSGTGIGILILAPVVERTIRSSDWRSAYLLLAGLVLALGLPAVLLLLRDRPADLGLLPDGLERRSPILSDVNLDRVGAQAAALSRVEARPWTLRRALGAMNFWLLMASGTLSLFTLRMVTVHQVSHFVDNGIPRPLAATILGGTGLVTAISFIFFGSLSDRIGRSRSFYIGALAQGVALILLLTVGPETSRGMLTLYALLWGIGEGSRSGLLTAIAGDLFAGPSLGAILGALGGFFGIGAAAGSWFGGYMYDLSASYIVPFSLALLATGAAVFFIAVVQLRLRRHAWGES